MIYIWGIDSYNYYDTTFNFTIDNISILTKYLKSFLLNTISVYSKYNLWPRTPVNSGEMEEIEIIV